MKIKLLLFLLFFLNASYLNAQKSPKREVRGAWIATFFNIDWPVKSQSVQQQKNAFINIINHHQFISVSAG